MVTAIFQGPSWFFGVDAVFEGIALVVSFAVFCVSLYMWRLSRLQRYKFFTVSFLSISISYFVRLLTNLLISTEYGASVRAVIPVPNLFVIGYGLHIFFALFGYLLLTIIALKVDKRPIAALMAILLVILIIFSGSYYTSYYLTAGVLLTFISYTFFRRWQEKKMARRLFVFLAFAFLALAQYQFLGVNFNSMFYVSAYVTLVIGSLFLFFALYISLKK